MYAWRMLVDSNANSFFQLDVNTVFVLGGGGNARYTPAPFG